MALQTYKTLGEVRGELADSLGYGAVRNAANTRRLSSYILRAQQAVYDDVGWSRRKVDFRIDTRPDTTLYDFPDTMDPDRIVRARVQRSDFDWQWLEEGFNLSSFRYTTEDSVQVRFRQVRDGRFATDPDIEGHFEQPPFNAPWLEGVHWTDNLRTFGNNDPDLPAAPGMAIVIAPGGKAVQSMVFGAFAIQLTKSAVNALGNTVYYMGGGPAPPDPFDDQRQYTLSIRYTDGTAQPFLDRTSVRTYPYRFRLRQQIEIWPIPDGVYEMRFEAYTRLPVSFVDTTPLVVPDRIVFDMALADGKLFQGKVAEADRLLRRAMVQVAALNARQHQPGYVGDGTRGIDTPPRPRLVNDLD